MPADFFRFKAFSVYQDKCAMKVCTDGCLFGGFLSAFSTEEGRSLQRVLDIGTGTGLLSLMYAQKDLTAAIDAVEIDKDAAMQAGQNFVASPWSKRLHVYNESIQQFSKENAGEYDLIFSNPPFYNNDLKSPDAKRNMAMHNDALGLDELLESIKKLLKKDGQFAVLLPYQRTDHFIDLCYCAGFYPQRKIFVRQSPKHSYFRSMMWLGNNDTEVSASDICIKDGDNEYTEAFTAILKDYYLKL